MFASKKKSKGVAAIGGGFIALLVVIIIAVAVVIPITQEVITDANFTGVLGTVMEIVPVLIGVSIVLIAVKLY